ncbi:CinA family protein [Kordiimonas sp. SCSIO 12610]|uniref:CinA family protein n=1 Tax=Kordiimonas sp. SCSIO 12610 TaxID=2829597 RepID=UPI00210A45DC|nr:CinA family protein [Kordiimonas sp. SCSIO 12610]UTW54019.1 CinA family protein [Kordiimonas sp. SCSIO 12610]
MFSDTINDLAKQTLNLARARGMMIATAESCTGGLIAGALTSIAGSSDVVDRGFVTYTNAAKQQMLDVAAVSLEQFGAVSETVAKEMAYGALVNSMADITVSVTGIAGPGGGSAEKPVGLVWIGVCEQGMAPEAFEHRFGDIGRDKIREKTVESALKLLIERLS